MMQDRAKAGSGIGIAAEVAAALDWWREAGVDSDFTDEPAPWLAPAEAKSTAQAQAHAGGNTQGTAPPLPRTHPKPAIDSSGWPQALADFTPWWLSEPALDDGRVTGRVPPRGPIGGKTEADIMVIVPDPERDDREQLLSGPQGRLLDAMLAAMGIMPEQVYLASVLPRHTPMADWPALAEKGFGNLLAHHVGLVKPERLIVLGSNILPLLGHEPAHKPAVSRQFAHEGSTIPLLAGKSLAALLERPLWKAGLWQEWLDWSGRPDR
ncbi:MAG: hypothetical protein LBV50_00945 [Novosphingobium sp.]|jgi:DNA polymerase|nr:hypothetical protein [Novosphingobium sp.]